MISSITAPARRGWPPSDSCSTKPSARARVAAKAAGQPATMSKTSRSKAKPTFARASAPATAASASSMAATVALRPGGLMPRSAPIAPVSIVAACRNHSIALRGEQIQTAKSAGTGQSVDRPSSGSRTTAETKDDAALLGRPGRTITVGRRMFTTSRKPLRVASCSSSSPIAFCAP